MVLRVDAASLAELDLPMFNEVARQAYKREAEWTRRDELAAQQIELLYLLQRTLIAVNSSKKMTVEPFVFPRPDDVVGRQQQVRRVSHRDMMGLAGRV